MNRDKTHIADRLQPGRACSLPQRHASRDTSILAWNCSAAQRECSPIVRSLILSLYCLLPNLKRSFRLPAHPAPSLMRFRDLHGVAWVTQPNTTARPSHLSAYSPSTATENAYSPVHSHCSSGSWERPNRLSAYARAGSYPRSQTAYSFRSLPIVCECPIPVTASGMSSSVRTKFSFDIDWTARPGDSPFATKACLRCVLIATCPCASPSFLAPSYSKLSAPSAHSAHLRNTRALYPP